MAKAFTYIPQRSFDAFVGDLESLDDVMAALAVDPLEAEDAYRLFGVKGIPHSLKDFADRGRGAYTQALETVAQWTMVQKDAAVALQVMLTYDLRIGTWCAAQVARESLELVSSRGPAPRIAVETAERWVLGQATAKECLAAARACFSLRTELMNAAGTGNASIDAAAAASLAAAYVASHPASEERYSNRERRGTGSTARAAATIMPYLSGALPSSAYWEEQRSSELRRLRQVVAAACLSYPVLP